MVEVLQSPAEATYWLISGRVLFTFLYLLGTSSFIYIVARRLQPLFHAERDFRFDRPLERLGKVLRFWLGQWKHPRYPGAGTMHILIFAGFIILVARAFSVLALGLSGQSVMPAPRGRAGHVYEIVAAYATTIVFLCMIIAAFRRLVLRPSRYEVPARYGKGHAADAIFLLGLIALLMLADSMFEATGAAALEQGRQAGALLPFLSFPWLLQLTLLTTPLPVLQHLYLGSFLVHNLTFFFLLCYRPFGIQFHV